MQMLNAANQGVEATRWSDKAGEVYEVYGVYVRVCVLCGGCVGGV